MKLVTLNEFKNVCDLPDSALVTLLATNSVQCQIDPEQGIMVDIDSASVKKLIQALITESTQRSAEEQRLLTEKAAKVIRENLDSILEEAIGVHLGKG